MQLAVAAADYQCENDKQRKVVSAGSNIMYLLRFGSRTAPTTCIALRNVGGTEPVPTLSIIIIIIISSTRRARQ